VQLPAGSIATNTSRNDKALPISMPARNGLAAGPWSSVPLWRGLDAAFLCEPSIPKAPPTPRIYIGWAESSGDEQSHEGGPNHVVEPKSANAALPKHDIITRASTKSPARSVRILVASAIIGFAAGIVVSWFCGFLG
jgi:hypothetical protein